MDTSEWRSTWSEISLSSLVDLCFSSSLLHKNIYWTQSSRLVHCILDRKFSCLKQNRIGPRHFRWNANVDSQQPSFCYYSLQPRIHNGWEITRGCSPWIYIPCSWNFLTSIWTSLFFSVPRLAEMADQNAKVRTANSFEQLEQLCSRSTDLENTSDRRMNRKFAAEFRSQGSITTVSGLKETKQWRLAKRQLASTLMQSRPCRCSSAFSNSHARHWNVYKTIATHELDRDCRFETSPGTEESTGKRAKVGRNRAVLNQSTFDRETTTNKQANNDGNFFTCGMRESENGDFLVRCVTLFRAN